MAIAPVLERRRQRGSRHTQFPSNRLTIDPRATATASSMDRDGHTGRESPRGSSSLTLTRWPADLAVNKPQIAQHYDRARRSDGTWSFAEPLADSAQGGCDGEFIAAMPIADFGIISAGDECVHVLPGLPRTGQTPAGNTFSPAVPRVRYPRISTRTDSPTSCWSAIPLRGNFGCCGGRAGGGF